QHLIEDAQEYEGPAVHLDGAMAPGEMLARAGVSHRVIAKGRFCLDKTCGRRCSRIPVVHETVRRKQPITAYALPSAAGSRCLVLVFPSANRRRFLLAEKPPSG